MPWIVAILAITTVPLLASFVDVQLKEYPMLPLILLWMVLLLVHDKIRGRLVPAVCWGMFALRDDDRLDVVRRVPG